MEPFALLQRIRRGGQIVRYHTHNLLKPPSNAEHMWNVAALCWQLDPELDARTLLTALFHDIAEYDTGDMPAWVKRANPELREMLAAAEQRALERMGMAWVEACDEGMHALVKVADYLDNVLTALDERRRGNAYAASIFHRGCVVALRKLETSAKLAGETQPAWILRAAALLGDIQAEYRWLAGDERFALEQARAQDCDYFKANGDTQRG